MSQILKLLLSELSFGYICIYFSKKGTTLNRLYVKYLFMVENKKQLFYLILIFLTVVDLLLMTYILVFPNVPLKFEVIAFDLVVCAIMWVEFIYSYLNADDKKTYLKNNSISVLGMLPIDIIFFRALRLIKLLQLIKLFVLARETRGNISNFLKQTYLDKIILDSVKAGASDIHLDHGESVLKVRIRIDGILNDYADCKYVSTVIFSRSNKTREEYTFSYDTSKISYQKV